MGGSQIWLSAGEKVILKDLLKATLVPSANDACVAIAQYIGGTREQINQKVKVTKKLTAPLKKGEPVGKLVLTHPDYKVGEVILVAAEKVERAGFFTLLFRWLENFIMNSLH